MKTSGSGMSQEFEDILDIALSDIMEAHQDAMGMMGPRPFGWQQGDMWSRLDYYLSVRDDPGKWQQILQQRSADVGPGAALAELWTEATMYERQLALTGGMTAEQWRSDSTTVQQRLGAIHRGSVSVGFVLGERMLQAAQRAIGGADSVIGLPSALVLPTLAPSDPFSMMEPGMTGEVSGEGESV